MPIIAILAALVGAAVFVLAAELLPLKPTFKRVLQAFVGVIAAVVIFNILT